MNFYELWHENKSLLIKAFSRKAAFSYYTQRRMSGNDASVLPLLLIFARIPHKANYVSNSQTD